MSGENRHHGIHVVRRVVHNSPRPELPGKAEPREQIEVTLIGGPFHNQKQMVWVDAKIIEVPYTPSTEPPKLAPPKVESSVTPDGHQILSTSKAAAEVPAVVCVYRRQRSNARRANFVEFR